jgi:hypothetical protein
MEKFPARIGKNDDFEKDLKKVRGQMRGDFSGSRFIPAYLSGLELKMVGKAEGTMPGVGRKIFESHDGQRFYSSDHGQWAAYELLKDYLPLSPVVYTPKYGFLSYHVPESQMPESLKYSVGPELLSLIFNDPDHSSNNIHHSSSGQSHAIYDTERVSMFWDEADNERSLRGRLVINRMPSNARNMLSQLAEVLHERYSSDEGLEEIKDIFNGRGILEKQIQPFSQTIKANHGPREFQQELLRRLKWLKDFCNSKS